MSAQPLPSIDGRRARRDQNRDRVVDALLEIYREGDLQPGVEQVAERSGVSHRSVFRYFEDLDELYRVAVERQFSSIFDRLVISAIGEGPLIERVDAIIENRQEIYEVSEQVSRVGHMLAPVEPIIAEHHREMARRAVSQVGQQFAPELTPLDAESRASVKEALAVALSIDSIDYLRHVRMLSRYESSAAIRATLLGLLDRTAPA
ncbi:MAG: TetR/AcrR family transcriptional regulator [Acidimicrobiales bacterium]